MFICSQLPPPNGDPSSLFIGAALWAETRLKRLSAGPSGGHWLLALQCFCCPVLLPCLTAAVSRRRHQQLVSVRSCFQPRITWSLRIPLCHCWRWLMFGECSHRSGGWCLLLPLHVSTWHAPSGKHTQNWTDYVLCHPVGCMWGLMSYSLNGWITCCLGLVHVYEQKMSLLLLSCQTWFMWQDAQLYEA